MKKIGLTLFTLCVLASSVATAADTKKTSRKVGEKTGDTPCTCVFNNKRMWNPEKILWDNKFFKCGHYLDDGSCEYVEEMKNVKIE